MQALQLDVPQQIPSTQLPLEQRYPALQAAPFGCFWHELPMQLLPPEVLVVEGAKALQSPPVLEQVLLHWPLLALHW